MTQFIQEIETHYIHPDPWGYQKNPDDLFRKRMILNACGLFGPFEAALDIGAGEGWITKVLPATEKYGFELSQRAVARFPDNVIPVTRMQVNCSQYDLVTVCGVLYSHYDLELFFELMRSASDIVVTSNIESWEVDKMSDPKWILQELNMQSILEMRFPYRDYYQKLRVLKVIHK